MPWDFTIEHDAVRAEMERRLAEIERLRAWAEDEQRGRHKAEEQRTEARSEIERLRAALETCESWIDRWTKHVGSCEGGDKCTCGRTAVLHEARATMYGTYEQP